MTEIDDTRRKARQLDDWAEASGFPVGEKFHVATISGGKYIARNAVALYASVISRS